MDQNSDPLPSRQADEPASAWAALVVQNGRLSGARKTLTAPITTIGRAESCDLRLNAESVHPVHCVLAFGPTGLALRNLQANNATLVNGQAVTACTLQQGDLLCIGPFQFQVDLSGNAKAASSDAEGREKQALRIQAAAVVAQQAALTEEEMRLQHRRDALDQQEQQLATHLEEKRRRLISLRDEARQAHTALQQVRASYEQRVAQIMRELAQSRRELADGQKQIQAERQHLLVLHKRLKRRFHRHWAGERMAMQLREAELAKQRRDLATESERLRREKTSLTEARLSFNGETELSRRSLQADWQHLRQGDAESVERATALDEREAMLNRQEHELAKAKRHWEQVRLRLEREVEDLENRIVNSRRKLLDQEEQRKRLSDPFNPASSKATATASESPKQALPAAALLSFGSQWLQRERQLEGMEAESASRLQALQQVAGELGDQRLYLAEQYERLGMAQQQWRQERESVATELEIMCQRLRQWEEALQMREQAVAPAEQELRQRSAEAARMQRHHESWQAGLVAREALWQGEQDRFLASLRAREDLAERRLGALIDLRERWGKRRQRQVCHLRAQRTACEELRREAVTLQQEWLRRSALVAKEQRTLAERALALEQYRQQCISRAASPKVAEKRLERLRRRWVALAASTERTIAQERKSLESQATRLEDRARQLKQDADELAAQEANQSVRQAAWEQRQLQDQAEQEALRQEVRSSQNQRRSYEQQLVALREEVERLARLLLDENNPPPLSISQAA